MVRNLTGKQPQYYEATLQLRDISEEIQDFVEGEISRSGMRIAKVIEHDNGVDLQLTDKNLTRNLGKMLQTKFGGECKLSTSLYGQKDGKEIYRLTVLFRSFGFKKGDKISYKGEVYEIKLLGKDLLMQNIDSGKKIHVKYEEMGKFKKVG